MIAKTLYGTDDYSRLDETQKQTISALSTLASGLAGGLTGDSAASTVAGAAIAEIANDTYQWFDLSQSGNENKTRDYGSSVSAGIIGGGVGKYAPDLLEPVIGPSAGF